MGKRGRKKNSAFACRKDELDRAHGATLDRPYPAKYEKCWGSDEEAIYLFDRRVDDICIDGYLLGKKNSWIRIYFDEQLDIYKLWSASCSLADRQRWINNIIYVFCVLHLPGEERPYCTFLWYELVYICNKTGSEDLDRLSWMKAYLAHDSEGAVVAVGEGEVPRWCPILVTNLS
jgi:hypothetical protein